jgi:hypothetical protein
MSILKELANSPEKFRNTSVGWESKLCKICNKITVHNRENFCLECGKHINEVANTEGGR